jgi:type I restriction enzyme M protein
MNMFMHGIEEFSIVRGDTLANPAFLENDELKKFNVILANPPYSIKAWDQKGFANDPYGRNLWGTPPQGCADYAFQQHIQKSLDSKNGRSCVLWPYGVLFRDSEAEMRKKMIEADFVECVIALGKNLFYNSIMESCLLITNNNKPKSRKGKILFIDARGELKREKTISYLMPEHIAKIHNTYLSFETKKGFSYVADIGEVIEKEASLNIPLYVFGAKDDSILEPAIAYAQWINTGEELKKSMNHLFETL